MSGQPLQGEHSEKRAREWVFALCVSTDHTGQGEGSQWAWALPAFLTSPPIQPLARSRLQAAQPTSSKAQPLVATLENSRTLCPLPGSIFVPFAKSPSHTVVMLTRRLPPLHQDQGPQSVGDVAAITGSWLQHGCLVLCAWAGMVTRTCTRHHGRDWELLHTHPIETHTLRLVGSLSYSHGIGQATEEQRASSGIYSWKVGSRCNCMWEELLTMLYCFLLRDWLNFWNLISHGNSGLHLPHTAAFLDRSSAFAAFIYNKPEERSEPVIKKKEKKETYHWLVFFLGGLEAQPPRGATQDLFRLLSSIWNLHFIESLLPNIMGYSPRGSSMDAFPLGLMNSSSSLPLRCWIGHGTILEASSPSLAKKRMPSFLNILSFESCLAFLQPPGRRYQTDCSQVHSLEFVVQTGSLQTMKSVKHTCMYMFM